MTNEAMLFLFGDADAVARNRRPPGHDAGVAVELYAQFLGTDDAHYDDGIPGDAVGDPLAKHPQDGTLTAIAYAISQRTHSLGTRDELERAALPAPNATAARLAARDRTHSPRTVARLKLEARVGRPMAVAGTTADGKPFTTADWKGKVVVVDFWATWCKPCGAQLPTPKAVYDEWHAHGLEFVGVSNDRAAGPLTAYTAAHGYPWPQLFDRRAAAGHAWNPTRMGTTSHPSRGCSSSTAGASAGA